MKNYSGDKPSFKTNDPGAPDMSAESVEWEEEREWSITQRDPESGATWTEVFSAFDEQGAMEKAAIAASFRDGVRTWGIVVVEEIGR